MLFPLSAFKSFSAVACFVLLLTPPSLHGATRAGKKCPSDALRNAAVQQFDFQKVVFTYTIYTYYTYVLYRTTYYVYALNTVVLHINYYT